MPHVDAPGVLQIAQYFSGSQGCTGSNIWHVVSDTPWDVIRINDALDIMETWEGAVGAPQRVLEVACTGFRATDLTSLTGSLVFRVENIAGQKLTPAAPTNATFALKLDTGFRGRGRNGRVFWFGLSEDDLDIAEVHTDVADSLVGALGSLIAAFEAAADMRLCVLHKRRDGLDLNPYEQSIVLSAAYTDNKIDSQRDRLPGHKRHKVKKTGTGTGGG